MINLREPTFFINQKYYTFSISAIVSDLFFFFIVVLFSGNTSTWNYPAYLDQYNTYSSQTYSGEWLFGLFQYSFRSFNIDFKYLVFILFSFGLLLMNHIVKKELGNKSLFFYLLFLLYPTGVAIAAIRNTVAMFLITFAIPYLSSSKRTNKIKFIIIILISAGFHRISYLYLFLLLKFSYEKHHSINSWLLKSTFVIVIINILIMLFYRPYLTLFQHFVLSIFEEDSNLASRNAVYFSAIANYGYILYISIQLVFITVIIQILKAYRLAQNTKRQIKGNIGLAKTILFANVFFTVLVLGYKMNSNFFRVFMNLLPINYIVIIQACNHKFWKINRNLQYSISFLFISLLIFSIYEVLPWFQYNFITMFTENWIFHLF